MANEAKELPGSTIAIDASGSIAEHDDCCTCLVSECCNDGTGVVPAELKVSVSGLTEPGPGACTGVMNAINSTDFIIPLFEPFACIWLGSFTLDGEFVTVIVKWQGTTHWGVAICGTFNATCEGAFFCGEKAATNTDRCAAFPFTISNSTVPPTGGGSTGGACLENDDCTHRTNTENGNATVSIP